MKYKIFLFILFVALHFVATAQIKYNYNHFGSKQKGILKKKEVGDGSSFRLNVLAEVWQTTQFQAQSFGLELEVYANENISIAWQCDIGSLGRGKGRYGHIPLGLWLAGYPLGWANNGVAANNNQGYLYLAILLAVIPETINFHIPLASNKIAISPYITPIGMHYLATTDSYTLGFTGGVKANIFIGKELEWAITPHIGWRALYKQDTPKGFLGGIKIGRFF
ncbi:MAG: hypothetical protein EAZ85_15790 [Bacteroidetes bacterium]|nr:MAG: hypothetical protein EAZ85_15790 [Bacteroidota bacterium]